MTLPGHDPSLLNDPEHWRRLALEMRRLAEGVREEMRASMLKIAIEYDTIAERSEKRLLEEKKRRGPQG